MWPAEDTNVFTALSRAFVEFREVTATQLQQTVLDQLSGSDSEFAGMPRPAAEGQIRSQQMSLDLLQSVLLLLTIKTDTQVTLHIAELQCSFNAAAAQHIHLAASSGRYSAVRPLLSDSELYTKAPTCFSQASCHTHCLICRRYGIKLIGSHIFPNKMVRCTTGPGTFSFNFATGSRGSPDILTYHEFCGACDGILNMRGEHKAGDDLERLAKNFRDAWQVEASRVPHFFYAMFSISWRILVRSLISLPACQAHLQTCHERTWYS